MKKKARIFMAILILDMFLGGICLSAVVPEAGCLSGESAEAYGAVEQGNSAESPVGEESEWKRTSERLLALTFDDGPHEKYTKGLLDGLRERKVKASFFLVGENIPGNEELVRQMAEDGHFIGVHCYSHVDLTQQDIDTSCRDIRKTADMIEKITGKRPEYIRPPYGKWNEALEECVEMLPVFWDIDTLDWKSQNSGKVLKHICKNAGKHQVVLLHDVFSASVDAALAAVDTLEKQGYTFVTVEELLID